METFSILKEAQDVTVNSLESVWLIKAEQVVNTLVVSKKILWSTH